MVKIIKYDDETLSINSVERSSSDASSVARSTGSSSSYNTFSSLTQGIRSLKTTTDRYLNTHTCSLSKLLELTISVTVGIGSGLAMMPIFDQEIEELENIGISAEDNRGVSAIITVNTLLIFGSLATISMYRFMQKKKNEEDEEEITNAQKIALKVGIAASLCSSVLPVSQLWNIELSDRDFIGSDGFDEFIAWGAATTVPLCIYKSIDAYVYLNSFIRGKLEEVELDNVGAKLFLYVPAALSFAGRFIAFSASASELGIALGIDEELSLVLGTLIGGVVGATVVGLAEYEAVKSLFIRQKEKISYKQFLGGVICAAEGMLLTLPLITSGLDVIEDTNPLIKGILFSPLFVSHSLLEARTIYMAFSGLFSKEEEQKEEQEIYNDIFTWAPVVHHEKKIDVENTEVQTDYNSLYDLKCSGNHSEIEEIA